MTATGWRTLEEALTLGYGTERAFCCPVHGDNSPSASVNSLTGWWFCYACGARGQADMSCIEIPVEAVQRNVQRAMEKLSGPAHPVYPESWLSVYDSAGPGEYWLSRFGADTCAEYRLGMDPKGDHATYPLRNNSGQVLGVVKRNLIDEDGPKYRYPTGVDISRLLFNGHRGSFKHLFLTEGATDAMAATEVGYHAVATYRNGVSRAQRRHLLGMGVQALYIAYDQDSAGEQGFEQVKELMPEVQVLRVRWSGAKDLAALPRDTRKEVLDTVDETRLGSSTCGSYEAGTRARSSSSSTRQPVVRLRMRSGSRT